jgi:hypothetical protein
MDWSHETEISVTYEDAVKAGNYYNNISIPTTTIITIYDCMDIGIPRIMCMGPRRSGKSSIERVVFHKMSPHETLFLESTTQVDIKLIANNSFVKFQTWDFAGDRGVLNDVYYEGTIILLRIVYI